MTINIFRTAPGSAATVWLHARIRALQGSDLLAAVTVVAPHHYAGLYLRRALAANGGYANVRFTVLARLAEMLGSGRVSRQGLLPLTAVVQGALIRSALRSSGGSLADASDHAGLVALVADLADDLQRRPDPEADKERIRAAGNPTSVAALDAIATYERLVAEHRRYDEVALIEAAAAELRSGNADHVLPDIGAVIVYLPDEIDCPSRNFLLALAERTTLDIALADVGNTPGAETLGDITATPVIRSEAASRIASVTIAVDAIEEVRSAVRECLAAVESDFPVPLHRQAIVYRDDDVYAQLLRDTLTAAGITFSSLDGRRLADTVPARALLGLIRLRDQDFARDAVLAWLSALPYTSGVLRNQARWDQLSRRAGVVRGVEQWTTRLQQYASRRGLELEALRTDDPDENAAQIRAIQRDVDDATRIVEQIQAIAELTRPPWEPTWSAHVIWLQRLRDEVLTPDGAWSEADVEAAQLVGSIIDGMAGAGDIEPTVTVGVVLRTLEDALLSRRLPEGRMGAGILIGPHRALLGIDVDRVNILGVLEGSFPSGLRVDPLLAEDLLERQPEHEARERREWNIAVSVSSSETVCSAPLVDVAGRAVYPSPWLLELLADGDTTPRASAVRSGAFAHPRLRRVGVRSVPDNGIAPLSLAERREWEALRAHTAGVALPTIALARRPDLPLHRALEVADARGSTSLTEFDGGLAAAAATSPLLSTGLTARPQSPTAVEQWAACPFHFLMARVLSVARTEDVTDERWWQVNAAERGSLIHAILAEFFGEVARSDDPAPGAPYGLPHIERMRHIAERHLDDARQRGISGHPLVWANERVVILDDLTALLEIDAENRADGGWRPAYLEQPFGMAREPASWPAAEIPLVGGTLVLRGKIDRVDVAEGRARVVDYKTGKAMKDKFSAANLLDRGRHVQLPMYAEAVRQQAHREGRPAPAITAEYWFATTRGGFKTVSLDVTPDVDAALFQVLNLVDDGLRAGCFPQAPGEHDDYFATFDNCRYCEYDTLCPAARDVLFTRKRGSPTGAPHRALAGDDGAPQ